MTAVPNKITGYTNSAQRNGSDIAFKSASISIEQGKLGAGWNLDFPELLDISSDDAWTIKVGIAGAEWTRIDSCPAENISGEDGRNASSRKVSCSAQSIEIADLRYYCLPKTLVFVNPAWMQGSFPTLRLYEGMICYGVGTMAAGQPPYRYYHPRLPGKDFKGIPGKEAADFECIIGPTTHHAVARYLANLIGFDLTVNTPDLALLDTMTIPSGTSWGEAITSIFSFWGATVDVFPASGGARARIVVSDILNGPATVPSLQTIKIDNPAIISTSFTEESGYSGGQRAIVDHVIVIGRKSTDSLSHLTREEEEDPADYRPIEIPVKPLDWNFERVASINVDGKVARYTRTGGASVAFGIPGEQSNTKGIKEQRHIMRFFKKEPEEPESPQFGKAKKVREPVKYIPIEDETQFYNVDDILVGKTVVKHKYSADLKPIVTIEEEWLLCNWPGQTEKSLRLLRIKTTLQNQFIKPLNQSQTSEFLEEIILFEWYEYTSGEHPELNGWYRVCPHPMADIVRQDYEQSAVDTSPDTQQDTVMLLTHVKMTDIQREHEDLLIKRDCDHAVLSDKFRMQSQILENPVRDRREAELGQKKDEITFRREYYYQAGVTYPAPGHPAPTAGSISGSGKMIGGYGPCFHKPVMVRHDDICTDDQAEMVADRIAARKALGTFTVTLKSPIPMPLQFIGTKIRIGAFTRTVNGSERTVAEADYALIGIAEKIEPKNYDQTLTARTRF